MTWNCHVVVKYRIGERWIFRGVSDSPAGRIFKSRVQKCLDPMGRQNYTGDVIRSGWIWWIYAEDSDVGTHVFEILLNSSNIHELEKCRKYPSLSDTLRDWKPVRVYRIHGNSRMYLYDSHRSESTKILLHRVDAVCPSSRVLHVLSCEIWFLVSWRRLWYIQVVVGNLTVFQKFISGMQNFYVLIKTNYGFNV